MCTKIYKIGLFLVCDYFILTKLVHGGCGILLRNLNNVAGF